MGLRHRVGHTERETVELRPPKALMDRVRFLRGLLGAFDAEEGILQALIHYDRAVCAAVVEGSRIVAHHRSGMSEDLEIPPRMEP